MAQRVTGCPLRDVRPRHGVAKSALDNSLMEMMTHPGPARCDVCAFRGEDVVPRPFSVGVRILSSQAIGHARNAHALPCVAPKELVLHLEMSAQRIRADGGERRAPILSTLAVAHHDLLTVEIDILHPKLHAFEQPQATAIHDHRAEARWFRK